MYMKPPHRVTYIRTKEKHFVNTKILKKIRVTQWQTKLKMFKEYCLWNYNVPACSENSTVYTVTRIENSKINFFNVYNTKIK